MFSRYFSQISEIADKLQSEELITQEKFEQYDNFIYELSYRCNIDNFHSINAIKGLEKRCAELPIRSKAIENQIEIYLDKIVRGSEVPKNMEFYKTIMEYFDKQMKGSALEINDNAAISHMIRIAQKGSLPNDISTQILDTVAERKNKNSLSEISNTEDFESYMQNVAEIRLQQGRMPREYSEYIIKQAILQKQDMTKFDGMLERALEDFTEYELEDAEINDYLILVLNQPFFDDKNTNGMQNGRDKRIVLSRQTLQEQGIIKLIETTLHESTHAIQDKRIQKGQLNRDTYKMLKEKILRRQDDKFYKTNYKYMYNEIDARKSGYVKRNKVLKKIGLTEAQIAELQLGELEQKVGEYQEDYEKGKSKKFRKEKNDVNTIFLCLLQEEPELLNQYPELKIEFKKNGETVQRKSLASILLAYEQLLSQMNDRKEIERTSSLYSDILLNGAEIPEEKMQEEIEQLMAVKSDNEIIKAFKDKLLRTRFPRQKVLVATVKEFYKNKSAQQRQDAQQEVKQVLKSKDKQNAKQQEENNEGRNR